MAELTARRRVLVSAICCMSLLIVGMDNTIVNMALPSIRTSLPASVEGLQWTIDAYTLVLASLLILAGSTAGRPTGRRIFQTGLVLFTLGCRIRLRCRPSQTSSRIRRSAHAQLGYGAESSESVSALVPLSVGRSPSLSAGARSSGSMCPSAWRHSSWRLSSYRKSRAPRARRVDPVGQLLVLVVLVSVTYAIINGPRAGWGSAQTWGLFALGAIAVLALLRYEPRRSDPLIELRFFRSLPFTGATVIAVCAFSGLLFLNTLYLQDVRHLSALEAGRFLLPMAVVTFVLAPVSGRIVGSRGLRLPLLIAGVTMCLGAAALTVLPQRHQLLLDGGWLHRLRHRFRHGERSDHQHRCIGYAAGSGRRRRGGGLDKSAGRRVPRRGHPRVGDQLRFGRSNRRQPCVGQPSLVVDHRGRGQRCWCSAWRRAVSVRVGAPSAPRNCSTPTQLTSETSW